MARQPAKIAEPRQKLCTSPTHSSGQRTPTSRATTRILLSFLFLADGSWVAEGSVIADDGKMLFDVSVDWSAGAQDARRHPLLRQRRLPKAERLVGTATVLATSESARFFHWMTDAVPRLQILRKAGPIPWEAIDHFLVSEGIPAIRESLRLLGIREEAIVVTRPESHFLCDWLIVPSFPSAPGNVPPWAIDFLRSQFLSTNRRVPARRLYLSRAKASGRKILNEDEIVPLLARRGFIHVTLEEMSLADQIALFSEAEAVVGRTAPGSPI